MLVIQQAAISSKNLLKRLLTGVIQCNKEHPKVFLDDQSYRVTGGERNCILYLTVDLNY